MRPTNITLRLMLASGAVLGTAAFAQLPPNPTQRVPGNPATVTTVSTAGTPVFRITVVDRTINAVSYRNRSGETSIDFRGTALMPNAKGKGRVESKKGFTDIEVSFEKVEPASKYGPEYLTYVLWAITPEGRASNLGEVVLDSGTDTKGKLEVTTELQAFGMIVTAEPYFAVTQPSDVVVLENIVRSDTLGRVEPIVAKYELLKRGTYTYNMDASRFPRAFDKVIPLEVYQARNAIAMAKAAHADRYAPDTINKASSLLQQAEDYQARKAGRKPVTMTARQAVQTAEDARLVSIRRMEEDRIAEEKRVMAQREADARASAQRESQRADAERLAAERSRLDADRSREEQAKAEAARRAAIAEQQAATADAQRSRQEAEQARLQAEAARAQAEQARLAAAAETERARREAEEANRIRGQAEAEKAELRSRLQQQLNVILETRESARGLIVNMSDVLFDTGQHTLKPGAREKLAKISGLVVAHPGLKLEVEGHTDSVGSDESNQRLSDRRADSVRTYLVTQGVPSHIITAKGFGESRPVASNDSASGRQQNRRVELVVSGEPIGISSTSLLVTPQQR